MLGFGTWSELNFVPAGFLLVDGMECSQTDYQALPNPLSPEQEAKVAAALQQALYPHAESRGTAPSPLSTKDDSGSRFPAHRHHPPGWA